MGSSPRRRAATPATTAAATLVPDTVVVFLNHSNNDIPDVDMGEITKRAHDGYHGKKQAQEFTLMRKMLLLECCTDC